MSLEPVPIILRRGTRSRINTVKTGSGLNAGEPYYITDEGRLAVGTAVNNYTAMAREADAPACVSTDVGKVLSVSASGVVAWEQRSTFVFSRVARIGDSDLSNGTMCYPLALTNRTWLVGVARTTPANGLAQIFRTVDAGSTWTAVATLDTSDSYVNCFLNLGSGTVLAFTSTSNRVWRSTDSGATWAYLSQIDTTTARTLFAYKKGDGTLLAFAGGGSSNTSTIYSSSDSGATWSFVRTLSGTACTAFIALASGTLLVGTYTGSSPKVWRSTDDGANWTENASALSGSGLRGFAESGGVIVCGQQGSGTVYRSTDDGLTWSAATVSPPGASDCRALVTVGAGEFLCGTSTAGGFIYRSTDYGVTWTQVQTIGASSPSYMTVAPVTGSDTTVFVPTSSSCGDLHVGRRVYL